MFTGIITAVGAVDRIVAADDRLRITIRAEYDDLALGESVAVNGACLTVIDRDAGTFDVEAIVTTRGRTTLAAMQPGDRVNLERALAVGERLGGHFVQGHVDGVGDVLQVTWVDDAMLVNISVPESVARVSVLHGSIAIDGVSMTVNDVPAAGIVQVALIPFTRAHTTLGELQAGDRVHLEGDMLGKYIDQLLVARGHGAPAGES